MGFPVFQLSLGGHNTQEMYYTVLCDRVKSAVVEFWS